MTFWLVFYFFRKTGHSSQAFRVLVFSLYKVRVLKAIFVHCVHCKWFQFEITFTFRNYRLHFTVCSGIRNAILTCVVLLEYIHNICYVLSIWTNIFLSIFLIKCILTYIIMSVVLNFCYQRVLIPFRHSTYQFLIWHRPPWWEFTCAELASLVFSGHSSDGGSIPKLMDSLCTYTALFVGFKGLVCLYTHYKNTLQTVFPVKLFHSFNMGSGRHNMYKMLYNKTTF